MILPITLTIAGAAAIVNIWLAIRIVTLRLKAKVMVGDGGHPLLMARMRAQGLLSQPANVARLENVGEEPQRA